MNVCWRSAPTASGCLNSWPSMTCLTACAPGTISPSISAVRKTLLPHTIGEELPLPESGVFHLMFLLLLHSAGRLVSVEIPVPSEPRHCDQLLVPGFSAANAPRPISTVNKTAISMLAKRFVISSLLNKVFILLQLEPFFKQLHERMQRLIDGRRHAQFRAAMKDIAIQCVNLRRLAARQVLRRRRDRVFHFLSEF
ncbi:MAG: hypothetical protein ALAOOOJD_01636 [bacterium]|nr:hypothetical protein [bacterium]